MHEAGFVILRDGTRTRAVNPRRDLVDDLPSRRSNPLPRRSRAPVRHCKLDAALVVAERIYLIRPELHQLDALR